MPESTPTPASSLPARQTWLWTVVWPKFLRAGRASAGQRITRAIFVLVGLAIAYSLNQWDALLRYTDDPALNIDNNTAERAIRAIAVGRKNWLFLGSDRGGQAAAIHFSLIASAKRHGLDPFAYLRGLLRRIPTHPNRDIEALFPDRWTDSTN